MIHCAAMWLLPRRSTTATATVATVPRCGLSLLALHRAVERLLQCRSITATACVAADPCGGAACFAHDHFLRMVVPVHCRVDERHASSANVSLWAFATGPSIVGPPAFVAPRCERFLVGDCNLSGRSAATRLRDTLLRKHDARRR